MNKQGISVAGLIIFIFGALVLGAAFALLAPLFLFAQAKYIFACISVSTAYIMYFLPMFAGGIRGSFANLAVSGTIYYRGVVAYTALTVANVVLAFFVLPLPLSIVVQGVGLFILLIRVCAALFTKDHINSTERSEEATRALVTALRDKAGSLTALTAALDRSDPLRIRAEKLAENMRYLSPAASAQARELERRLTTILDTILMDGALRTQNAAANASLMKKFDDFDAVYRERKSIH